MKQRSLKRRSSRSRSPSKKRTRSDYHHPSHAAANNTTNIYGRSSDRSRNEPLTESSNRSTGACRDDRQRSRASRAGSNIPDKKNSSSNNYPSSSKADKGHESQKGTRENDGCRLPERHSSIGPSSGLGAPGRLHTSSKTVSRFSSSVNAGAPRAGNTPSSNTSTSTRVEAPALISAGAAISSTSNTDANNNDAKETHVHHHYHHNHNYHNYSSSSSGVGQRAVPDNNNKNNVSTLSCGPTRRNARARSSEHTRNPNGVALTTRMSRPMSSRSRDRRKWDNHGNSNNSSRDRRRWDNHGNSKSSNNNNNQMPSLSRYNDRGAGSGHNNSLARSSKDSFVGNPHRSRGRGRIPRRCDPHAVGGGGGGEGGGGSNNSRGFLERRMSDYAERGYALNNNNHHNGGSRDTSAVSHKKRSRSSSIALGIDMAPAAPAAAHAAYPASASMNPHHQPDHEAFDFVAVITKFAQDHSRSCSVESRAPTRGRSLLVFPKNNGSSQEEPLAVFIMGMPGAGKSKIKADRYGDNVEQLDRGNFEDQCNTWSSRMIDINPDRIKPCHPAYQRHMGPAQDSAVHSWSVRQAAKLVEQVCKIGRDFVLDATGANPRWMIDRIQEARGKYRVKLIFVDCPLEIALFRNRNRAALDGGGGWVPEDVLIEKASKVHASFQKLSREVDEAERVWNPGMKSEMEAAILDLYCYPAPKSRPPIRPGDVDGEYAKSPQGGQPGSQKIGSRRILRMANWKRSDYVADLKRDRLQWIDRTQPSREYFIIHDVFKGDRNVDNIVLEVNKYPYHMPDRVEHLTLWAYKKLTHRRICDYIEKYIEENRADVVAWNYDNNADRRTVDIDHVHIYLSTRRDAVSICPTVKFPPFFARDVASSASSSKKEVSKYISSVPEYDECDHSRMIVHAPETAKTYDPRNNNNYNNANFLPTSTSGEEREPEEEFCDGAPTPRRSTMMGKYDRESVNETHSASAELMVKYDPETHSVLTNKEEGKEGKDEVVRSHGVKDFRKMPRDADEITTVASLGSLGVPTPKSSNQDIPRSDTSALLVDGKAKLEFDEGNDSQQTKARTKSGEGRNE